MIQPTVNPKLQKWFNCYIRWFLLRRYFAFIGRIGSIDVEPDVPVLYMMNHSSWWDRTLVCHAIQQEKSGTHYLMMDDPAIKSLPFLRKLGTFPMGLTSSTGESIQYAVQSLRQGKRVWLFPQGEIQHLDQRPLVFQSKVGSILQECPQTRVMPVTLQYHWGLSRKQEATFWFGDLLGLEWSTLTQREIVRYLEVRLEKQLDEHKSLILSQPVGTRKGFVPIQKGK
ncbi:lysophospholipid acyltransferase family protein [Desmospora profundinema]|uniref:1-acyl-sn-glycerol-3-phosphate acyltransferase n=1 Tax=Desmospora profundinema TaxID=1571184 RepID=A0ABU1IQ41_9BACL|nr:lysophospholipid acyltransferase family protein [Desmospora profundinema]MDR6226909.1 1-acyl-sn-glycerol-3-phosphate acyltransferase [Desmospora profundinema]